MTTHLQRILRSVESIAPGAEEDEQMEIARRVLEEWKMFVGPQKWLNIARNVDTLHLPNMAAYGNEEIFEQESTTVRVLKTLKEYREAH